MSDQIINISQFSNSSLFNLTDELRQSGARVLCINETWSMNFIVFALMNVISLVFMAWFYDHGKPEIASRGINILFLINTFGLVSNIVIAFGLKFLPV